MKDDVGSGDGDVKLVVAENNVYERDAETVCFLCGCTQLTAGDTEIDEWVRCDLCDRWCHSICASSQELFCVSCKRMDAATKSLCPNVPLNNIFVCSIDSLFFP